MFFLVLGLYPFHLEVIFYSVVAPTEGKGLFFTGLTTFIGLFGVI